ncbi:MULTISPECIES: serine/threonine-protein kinase [Nonomuraea]|uniref:non-specific serine/threonine protein kinase n=1 Tax=Nonomuraea mangrovi TaxID=2316207 RepID=A0ABW4T9S1_9ACTN
MRVGNRYRLIESIGEGGMGIVWRAHDDLLDRTVAIKEVRYTGIGEQKRAQLNQRTIREARAAGRLDHPNVIVIHDVIEEDGRPWIVMQLVRSRSLAETIRQRGPLPVPEVARIGGAVLGALLAAHAAGVLHRDVKPENVLLAEDGRVVLTDFGIAAVDAEAGLTATGNLVGTPAYMPPERLNGLPATPASDLWSLGATLHTAVEGGAPYQRDSWAATVAAVLRDSPEPPRLAGPLAPVITGLLQRDPATRMGAQEVMARLAALESAGHAVAEARPRPQGPDAPATLERPVKRRSPLLWAVPSILLAAGLAGGGVWLAMRPAPSDTAPPTSAPTTAHGTTTASGSATPTKSAPPTTAPTPGGTASSGEWRLLTSRLGRFSVSVPQGWSAKKIADRDSVIVTGPGAPGALIIEWTEAEDPVKDPVEAWRRLEKEIQAKGEFTDYKRVGIRPLTYLGMPAADWEFTRRKGEEIIHVVNRGFRLADGRPYAVYWETPEASWREGLPYFDRFVETFQPT